MHCVHLFQQPTGSLQGRCSFQLVPNQVYKDDLKKQPVCFKYFLYCKYFTVSGILAICWKDIHIYIYTLYFMYTQIFNSPLKLTATLVMIPISFSIDYFTSTSDPTPRTWSASWLNLCMKQEIWWMGCLLGLGDMCVFPLIWWWYPQPKNTCQ